MLKNLLAATGGDMTVPLIVLISVCAAVVLLAIVVIVLLVRRKKLLKKSEEAASAEPASAAEPEIPAPTAEPPAAESLLPDDPSDPQAEEVAAAEAEPEEIAGAEESVVAEECPAAEEPEAADAEEEPAALPVTEPVVITAASADGEGGSAMVGGKRIYVMYNRSFTAKLIQADETVQERYGAVKNALLSYGKVKSRMGWKNETFRRGRATVAKCAIRGKTLSLYLALDPSSLEGTKYRFENASDIKRFAATPVRLKLKSARSVRYAIELIAAAMANAGAVKGADRTEDYRMPYEETDALIRRGLIKMLATDEEGTETASADFAALSREKFHVVTGLDIRPSVSVTEAATTISDEVAATFIEQEEKKTVHRGTKKSIVNIDTLSENFADGETVDLIALKVKGLIGKNVGYVKVLARGVLSHALTVKAQDFSLDAVKMIVMTGGAAVID